MWNDLTPAWQTAFELAWEAFCHGSIPIGAIITDEAGRVLSTGRNLMGEGRVPNPRTAHAEAQCVRDLDTSAIPDTRRCHLYTTMEPCPMCIGTIVMGGIYNIHVAARDNYCGALHYLQDDPFLQSKQVNVRLDAPHGGSVQIAMQTCHELRRFGGKDTRVLQKFAEQYPREVALGRILYREGTLERCAEQGMPCGEVFDSILAMLESVV